MGRLTASWHPEMSHSTVAEDVRGSAAKVFTAKTVASIYQGSWKVSNEWNQLLSDYKFTSVEEFLQQWWGDN